MGRNSKLKRDTKREKALKKQNQLKQKNINSTNNSSGPILAMVPNFFGDLTDAQRKQMISVMSEKGKNDIEEILDFLKKTLRKYEPLTLLSMLSCYGLTVGISNKGIKPKNRQMILQQAHVELLQALVLQIPENELGQEIITPDIVQDIWEKLLKISQASTFSRMNDDILETSQIDKAINKVQSMIRNHTQMVRNWGFHSQIVTISKEIYSHFDQDLLHKFGFSASATLDVFETMLRLMEQKLSKRALLLAEIKSIKKPYDMLVKYYELTGQGKENVDDCATSINLKKISHNELFAILLSHFDLNILDSFCFSSNEIAENLKISTEIVDKILSYFSYNFGDLENEKTSFFFLENPVWKKPVIKLHNNYCCILPQLFFSYSLTLLDELIEKVNKNSLYKRKANYLECKIEEVVKRRFPDSQIISGVKWNLDNTQYETDLLIFIDSYAIIIEAKSQRISKPALRGAPDRIKKHLEEILIEPSIQSHRLEQKLNVLKSQDASDDPLLKELPVNIHNIHQVLRVSVSLDYFATLQANLRFFEGTGWLPVEFVPCPSMNIADFETLFDFLEHPVQIIHYLTQRTRLISNYPNIVGDELDFMGLYISTLLNIGNMFKNAEDMFHISDMSEPLEKFYMAKDEGILFEKPQPNISPLFKKIMSQLEERAVPRWTEIGCILNYFTPDDQIKLTKAINKHTRIINKTWRQENHKNIIICSPPKSSEYAIAIVLFKNENKDKRYEFIDNACAQGLEPEHVKYCLIIAINIDKDDLPYHYIALVENESRE